MNWRTNRRKLLGASAGLAGLAASGVGIFLPDDLKKSSVAAAADVGEAWGGFLILPIDEPRPMSVTCSGCEHATDVPSETLLPSAAELAKRVGFPVYELSGPPAGLTPRGAILSSDGGVPRWGSVYYAQGDVTVATLTASDRGLRPYPVWETRSAPSAASSISRPVKTNVGGNPALRSATQEGSVLHWFEGSVLYHLVVEAGQGGPSATDLADSLAPVRA